MHGLTCQRRTHAHACKLVQRHACALWKIPVRAHVLLCVSFACSSDHKTCHGPRTCSAAVHKTGGTCSTKLTFAGAGQISDRIYECRLSHTYALRRFVYECITELYLNCIVEKMASLVILVPLSSIFRIKILLLLMSALLQCSIC